VDSTPGEAREHALVAIHDAFDGLVIREHRHDGVGPANIGNAGGGSRVLFDEFVSFRACPVVDGHLVPGLQQVCRHTGAHVPKSDETNLHRCRPSLLVLVM
jgi:hypothetical protein